MFDFGLCNLCTKSTPHPSPISCSQLISWTFWDDSKIQPNNVQAKPWISCIFRPQIWDFLASNLKHPSGLAVRICQIPRRRDRWECIESLPSLQQVHRSHLHSFESCSCVTFAVVLQRLEGAEGRILIKKVVCFKGRHSSRSILLHPELCFTLKASLL